MRLAGFGGTEFTPFIDIVSSLPNARVNDPFEDRLSDAVVLAIGDVTLRLRVGVRGPERLGSRVVGQSGGGRARRDRMSASALRLCGRSDIGSGMM